MNRGTKVLETAGGGMARGSTLGRSEGRHEDKEARSLDRQEETSDGLTFECVHFRTTNNRYYQ